MITPSAVLSSGSTSLPIRSIDGLRRLMFINLVVEKHHPLKLLPILLLLQHWCTFFVKLRSFDIIVFQFLQVNLTPRKAVIGSLESTSSAMSLGRSDIIVAIVSITVTLVVSSLHTT